MGYDAGGFKNTENTRHQEYQVSDIRIHDQYDSDRLTYDLAVLKVETRSDGFGGVRGRINLVSQQGVNAACLPACGNMFDYKFNNGTGVRCWVAGWGRDGEDGQFSFIQRKVDVPIFDRSRCENVMKQELSNRFRLRAGEVCAGGEAGKDACDGDGGSPLVCQSEEGNWHVVGLVAWVLAVRNAIYLGCMLTSTIT